MIKSNFSVRSSPFPSSFRFSQFLAVLLGRFLSVPHCSSWSAPLSSLPSFPVCSSLFLAILCGAFLSVPHCSSPSLSVLFFAVPRCPSWSVPLRSSPSILVRSSLFLAVLLSLFLSIPCRPSWSVLFCSYPSFSGMIIRP